MPADPALTADYASFPTTLHQTLARTFSGRSVPHLRAEADLLEAIQTLARRERFLADAVLFEQSLRTLLGPHKPNQREYGPAVSEAREQVRRCQLAVDEVVRVIQRAEQTMRNHEPLSDAIAEVPDGAS